MPKMNGILSTLVKRASFEDRMQREAKRPKHESVTQPDGSIRCCEQLYSPLAHRMHLGEVEGKPTTKAGGVWCVEDDPWRDASWNAHVEQQRKDVHRGGAGIDPAIVKERRERLDRENFAAYQESLGGGIVDGGNVSEFFTD